MVYNCQVDNTESSNEEPLSSDSSSRRMLVWKGGRISVLRYLCGIHNKEAQYHNNITEELNVPTLLVFWNDGYYVLLQLNTF